MVRLAVPLLAALMAVALVGCSSDDDGSAAPPLEQRFLTAEDAPGSKADPVEKRQTSEEADDFAAILADLAVDPDLEELTTLLEEAGFQSGGVDTRFLGETHANVQETPHVASSSIELESGDGAMSALDWLEQDALKPCPESCAVQMASFEVDGIEDSRGVHRVATAEDIERAGLEDQQPLDSYWVGFTDGAFVYAVDLRGAPGAVSEEQAEQIAAAYYARVTGN